MTISCAAALSTHTTRPPRAPPREPNPPAKPQLRGLDSRCPFRAQGAGPRPRAQGRASVRARMSLELQALSRADGYLAPTPVSLPASQPSGVCSPAEREPTAPPPPRESGFADANDSLRARAASCTARP